MISDCGDQTSSVDVVNTNYLSAQAQPVRVALNFTIGRAAMVEWIGLTSQVNGPEKREAASP